MVGIEGIGEAVTGGMIARAVEPEHGEAGAQERSCLNCGAALSGPYCGQCGQKAHVHRTLRGFGHDLLHSVLHFEGKIWRTLPLLAWRPGEVTRRYIEGERAQFVSPIALFLFSVFLMFAVFGTIGGPFAMDASSPAATQARSDLEAEARTLRTRAEALERQRRTLAANGRPTGAIDAQLAAVREELRGIETTQTFVLVPNAAPDGSTRTVDMRGIDIETGWARLDHAIDKARENPSLLAYKLQSNAYKFSWALIPISVPFLWLLFLHRRRYRQYKAYDHVVFVTYSIAFMSLGLILLSLLRPLGFGEGFAVAVVTFGPPIHIYRQLRGAYGLGRLSAIWRTAALLLFAIWALSLFLLLLLAIGVLG